MATVESMDPKPRVAIVSGASSGIGRATALELARAGWSVVLVARSAKALEEVAQQVVALAPQVTAAVEPADLRDAGLCRDLVRRVDLRFGRIDALANVAGCVTLQPITQVTPDLWQQTIDTNLSSVVHLTSQAWPVMARTGGVIVNISSMASVDPFPGLAIYAAAKAGVNLFTKGIAKEGEAVGLRAVCIAPGAVETPLLRNLFDVNRFPPSRTLSPESVAQLITGCITGDHVFINGETILMPSP